MALFEHDITEVSVLIITAAGVTIDVNGGEKEKVKYKRRSPYWVTKMDTSSNMARGVNPDNSGEITISLLKNNPQNLLMQGLVEASQDSNLRKLLLDTSTITVIDRLSGKTKCLGRLCFIEEQPEGVEEIDPSQVDWKFLTPDIKITELGGLFRV